MKLIELSKKNVWVEEIYLPFLGKCVVNNSFDEKTNSFVAVSARVLNKHRVDENGNKFEIIGDADYTGAIDIKIDYDNKRISGHYYKKWEGGETEKYNFNFIIDVNSIKARKDPMGIDDSSYFVSFGCYLGE